MREVEAIKKLDGVQVTTADQCMYGLKTWTVDKSIKDVPARKSTRFMTNSECIAEQLQTRCDRSHTHQPLENGRAKEAATYPRALCEAIVQGLIDEKKQRVMNVRCLLRVEPTTAVEANAKENKAHEQEQSKEGIAWDDVTGEGSIQNKY